jgi:hypothetical protein
MACKTGWAKNQTLSSRTTSTKQIPHCLQFAAPQVLVQEFSFHHEMHGIKFHLRGHMICSNSIFPLKLRFGNRKIDPELIEGRVIDPLSTVRFLFSVLFQSTLYCFSINLRSNQEWAAN